MCGEGCHGDTFVDGLFGMMARPPYARRALMAGALFRRIEFGKRRRAYRSTSSTSNAAGSRTPVARITTRMATAMDDSSLWRRNRDVSGDLGHLSTGSRMNRGARLSN